MATSVFFIFFPLSALPAILRGNWIAKRKALKGQVM
jgi:hypothetical protein